MNIIPTKQDIKDTFPIQSDWSFEDKCNELGKIRGAESFLSLIESRLINDSINDIMHEISTKEYINTMFPILSEVKVYESGKRAGAMWVCCRIELNLKKNK
jgi:hypothetical protein